MKHGGNIFPYKLGDRHTTVFMTHTHKPSTEVLEPERRRRWTVEEKLAMVRESFEPGQTVSLVARRHGINPNQSDLHIGASFIRMAACQP